MSVAINRPTPNTLRVVLAVDITDIVAAAGISNAEKRAQSLRRALDELAAAVAADARTDADLDAEAARAAAEVARKKAMRPTGTF